MNMATSIIQGCLALFRLQSKQEKIEIDFVCGLIRTVACNGHERACHSLHTGKARLRTECCTYGHRTGERQIENPAQDFL